MIDDVYNAKILGFAGNIGRIGRLEAPDATATAHSKLCGSTVTVDIRMEGDVVTDFAHEVKACALGQASSSIMAQNVVGASADELRGGARDDAPHAEGERAAARGPLRRPEISRSRCATTRRATPRPC
jgi:NifU-like protein involved in Fe-S cluster formation